MIRNVILSIVFGMMVLPMIAQKYDFDMTSSQPRYDDSTGFGYDITGTPKNPGIGSFFFSVKVLDGNYKVTVTLGSKKTGAETVVRAESRRLFVENQKTAKGKFAEITFIVNKHSPQIDANTRVRLKEREWKYLNWDDKLTLEFNGANPAVSRLKIERDTTATTVFLCGNSTVVDNNYEPYTSWGQMIPRWFGQDLAICNIAESGLTATLFLRQNRLQKIVSMLHKGDYVICEFGHNDQKEHSAGAGAWYNFSSALKQYIDIVRKAEGNIIFVTPTQRRKWDKTNTKIMETHGDYPDAMRAVAKRERVPVIELHDMTRTFFETLGYEDSKRALVHYPAGTYPGQKTDLADNTHFNPYGAYEVAKMVVKGMKDLNLPIISSLRQEWNGYGPEHPDDWKSFKWYDSPVVNITKPDGN